MLFSRTLAPSLHAAISTVHTCARCVRSYFIAYQGEWTAKDPVKAYVMANATKKIDLKFAVAFLRGIGANWLVCLAWWQAISSKDTVSKILSVRCQFDYAHALPPKRSLLRSCTRMT